MIEMMDKKLLKELLQELLDQRQAIRFEMERLIYSYLKHKGDIKEGTDPRDIAYKKVMREEFGLVV